MNEERLPLSRLIMAVTAELRKAEQQARDRRQEDGEENEPIMQFAECELEMGVEIETKGEGGVDVWVFKLGGGRTKKDVNTVRIKFSSLPGGHVLMYPMQTEGAGPELG